MRLQQAGDVHYEAVRRGVLDAPRTDPWIASYVHDALSDARTVVNVGAGAGSCEPADPYIITVEPSASRAQRPGNRPAIDAIGDGCHSTTGRWRRPWRPSPSTSGVTRQPGCARCVGLPAGPLSS